MKKYLFSFNKKIKNMDFMIAHKIEGETPRFESLMEHSELVMEKLFLFDDNNSFLSSVKLIIKDILVTLNLFENNDIIEEYIFKWFLNAVYLHDVGKSSIGFQYGVMKNENFKDMYESDMSNNHSPFSTRIYLDFCYNDLISNIDNDIIYTNELAIDFLSYIIVSFSYCIQKHHSSLQSMSLFFKSFESFLMEEDEDTSELKFKKSSNYSELCCYMGMGDESKFALRHMRGSNIDSLLKSVSRELLLLNKILYSVLVTSDSVATSEYMTGCKISLNKINIDEVMDTYRDSKLYKGIQEHFKSGIFENSINGVRCDIFKESDENLTRHIDKNIFYLEAPTGSGKTNTSMNIAFRAVELTQDTIRPLNRIIYTAPFNTITTQTTNFLNKLFKDTNTVDISEINSNSSIKVTQVNGEDNYELSLLDYQMMNYPISLTSHVKLFSILFGTSRLDNHSLIHLFNSVIVIDEIQAYNTDVWAKMITLLDIYSKYMNIKFVIMSATLPKISALIKSGNAKSNYAELIVDSSKYFESKYFKNRISKYNFEMLSDEFLSKKDSLELEDYKTHCYDAILNKIRHIYNNNNDAKILVEFITKKSCRDFYKYLKDAHDITPLKDGDLPIKEVTSDDNVYFKNSTINMVTTYSSIIVVSTQCIEAGVDINMDYGFKDISYVDNEEQFLGRIRREYDETKYSEAIFFNLDDADKIYGRNSHNYKSGLSIIDEKYRNILETKKFSNMFGDLLQVIERNLNSLKDGVSRDEFDLLVSKLSYLDIYDSLELIKEKTEFSIFIPFDVTLTNSDENCMSNNTSTYVMSGVKIWDIFKKSLKEPNYAKRKVAIFNALPQLSYFVYKYLDYNFKTKESFEAYLNSKGINFEFYGGVYYLDIDADLISKFIDSEYKFDKLAFDNYTGSLFI